MPARQEDTRRTAGCTTREDLGSAAHCKAQLLRYRVGNCLERFFSGPGHLIAGIAIGLPRVAQPSFKAHVQQTITTVHALSLQLFKNEYVHLSLLVLSLMKNVGTSSRLLKPTDT